MFDRLLGASSWDLLEIFNQYHAIGEIDNRLTVITRRLNLNVAQLLCGLRFNPRAREAPLWLDSLGYTTYETLCSQADYFYINDIYYELSIDNIVSIYTLLGTHTNLNNTIIDSMISRLDNIEGRLHETISPVVISSYKLEIQTIYSQGLMPSEYIKLRLTGHYALLRQLCNEAVLMGLSKAIPIEELFTMPGLTPKERQQLVLLGLVSESHIKEHLSCNIPDIERTLLQHALTQLVQRKS